MERIFRILPMTDGQKIDNASDVLKGEAQNWWVNVLHQGTPITWDGFKAEFNRRFFPRAAHNVKKKEFDSLQQGDMTVTEYTSRYNALLRFGIGSLPTEEDRARKFEGGLRENIRSRVETYEHATVSQVQQTALVAEGGIERSRQSH